MGLSASEFSGLAFSFAETLSEIESIQQTSAKFIDKDSMKVLPTFRNNLLNFQSNPQFGRYTWQIPENQPLCTDISDGEFEPGNHKGIAVYGSISGVWEIEHASGLENKYYVVNGNSSVKISIFVLPDNGESQEIARWRFEMGAHDSPGCHFHTQILGGKDDVSMFPHNLPVPRLPSLMITVTDALDYLLGELFQDRWKRKVSQGGSGAVGVWANLHRRRLISLLEWKRDVANSSGGSPWAALKASKPSDRGMFLKPGVKI